MGHQVAARITNQMINCKCGARVPPATFVSLAWRRSHSLAKQKPSATSAINCFERCALLFLRVQFAPTSTLVLVSSLLAGFSARGHEHERERERGIAMWRLFSAKIIASQRDRLLVFACDHLRQGSREPNLDSRERLTRS